MNIFRKTFFLIACFFIVFSTTYVKAESLDPKLQLIVPNPGYDPGMFSVFCSVISALDLYDRSPNSFNGIEVRLASGRYFDSSFGLNWWDYFFEPISISHSENFIPYIFEDPELVEFGFGALKLSRERGHELIKKYVKLNKKIESKLNAFVKEHFAKHYVIGIHYRGTDKSGETGRKVSYEEVEAAIRKVESRLSPQKRRNIKIFIATDEQAFIEYIRSRFSCPICFIEAERASGDLPTHWYSYVGNNYKKGEDALMDCLLLSRTHFLIRTVSNLSFMSERFTLRLPVICLR
jgi:hypothetical protein